jgi:CheY-like chemotaxis protein
VPTQIVGDGLRLRQILINLLGNAVKFTSKGEIFLHVKVLQIDAEQAELEFNLRDTGIGIPPDKLERLFKPFSQVDSSTTRKYGGTGLGLAICEKLVHLMGGQITVASTPDVGTTFTFTIRTCISVIALKTYVGLPANGLEGKAVLVVDDNATNRRIVTGHLEQWKFNPMVVSSAREALDLAAKNIPLDLVITDMHMPEMDGVALAKSLKQKNQGLPIILLSSVGDERRPEYTSLFAAILLKPAKLSQLYNHIIYALKENTQLPPVQAPSSKLPSDLSSRYPLKVMIADDNPINQKLTERIFVKMGYAPVIVSNGVQVLEAIEGGFDLIMMDVQMPEMDGLEATRLIRSQSQIQPVIVAMTANAMDSDREQCINAGMDDYLSKPIQLEQMVQIIEKWAIKISVVQSSTFKV